MYTYIYIHKGLPVTLLDNLEQCHWTLGSEMELQATTTMHDTILHCNHLAGNPTVSTASRALKAEGEHGGNVWRIRIALENCAQMYFEFYVISFDGKNARKTLTLYPASSSYHYQTTGSRSVKVSQPPSQTYPGSAQNSPNLASKWHWALKMQLPGDSSLSNSCGFRDVAKHNIISIVNGSKVTPYHTLKALSRQQHVEMVLWCFELIHDICRDRPNLDVHRFSREGLLTKKEHRLHTLSLRTKPNQHATIGIR